MKMQMQEKNNKNSNYTAYSNNPNNKPRNNKPQNNKPQDNKPQNNKPRNNKPQLKDETFVNPYNFIPIVGECDRAEAKNRGGNMAREKRYTGYFDCSLRLLTPLLIPNTSCDHIIDENSKENSKSFEFFSYENLSALPARKKYPDPPKAPVIPGSELRGAVRSVYEAAFRGCFSSVSQNQTLRRRTSPKRPGILRRENGKWYLTPCSRAMLNVDHEWRRDSFNDEKKHGKLVEKKVYDQWKEGQKIYIQLNDNDYKDKMKGIRVVKDYYVPSEHKQDDWKNSKPKGNWLEGWLHKGEVFSARKHHESVFYEKSGERIIVTDEDIKLLKDVVKEYRNKKINRFAERAEIWYQDFPLDLDEKQGRRKDEELSVIPIYYEESSAKNDGCLYLCPACIGKEIFNNSIPKLLAQKVNGYYQPCSDSGSLCSCCRVFGMAAKGTSGEKGAFGSRVRFTDAVMKKEMDAEEARKMFYKPVLLPEMGEPKPSTVEFYTQSPYPRKEIPENKGRNDSMRYWTYDYSCEKVNGRIIRHSLKGNEHELKLRGRKFYWHSENWKSIVNNDNKGKPEDKKNKKMRQWMRPLKETTLDGDENTRFYFRVFFEKLFLQELSRLRWSLDFRNCACAHKIGHAKPLGFGSVRIEIQELALRSIDEVTGKWAIDSMLPEEMNIFLDAEKIDATDEAVKTILVMANWKKKPGDVSYPKAYKISGKQDSNKPEKINENASHQWFRNNKKLGKDGNDLNPSFGFVLPRAEEELDKNKRLHTIEY